ncbi:hypothetical protein BDF14DRAFT_1806723 [Spinellus fusiger]|nr:hypothetical protein BDF14DRAFT_1806723 [Spinellus fusiger]
MSSDSGVQLTITTVDYQRKDPVFWIEARATLQKYKQKHRRFPRYYSELKKLHHHLEETLEDVWVPVLPDCPVPRYDRQGRIVGRHWWFTLRDYAAPEDIENRVEYRVQQWLHHITHHPRIQQSEGLREFVESDTGFRPQLIKHRRPRATVAMNDTDPATTQYQSLFTLQHTLQSLLQQIERVKHSHFVMGQTLEELASVWVVYGARERNPELFIIYKSMTKALDHLSGIERSQGRAMAETLEEETHYQIKMMQVGQDTVQRRLEAHTDYLHSIKGTETYLRQVERLKSSVTIDRGKANGVIADLENARRHERERLRRYESMNRHLQQDLYAQTPHQSKQIVTSLRDYAKSQLFLEKQKLMLWQSIHSSI